MSSDKGFRTYIRADCAVFRKTAEAFGGLSNMSPGYPIRINGVRILTVEALYQACRFPHLPDVQRKIIAQTSPMTAKMVGKPYRNDSRLDWDRVRVKIMRWVLRLKLAMHWTQFKGLLLSTGNMAIVEDSRKDDFWGAISNENDTLVGMNVLGRLLMELREEIKQGAELRRVEPPAIANFLLFGEPLQAVDFRTDKNVPLFVDEIAANDSSHEPTLPLFAEATTVVPTRPVVMATAISVERSPAMIEGLKPYAAYKESGQDWLGNVPAHWDIRRTKLLLREVDSRSTTGKEQLLRVSQYTGVTQRKASDGSDAPDTRAASLVGYKRVSANDLVINIMLAWNGSLGASRYDGIASPAYCVYRFRKNALPWYYHELFRLPLYKGRIKTASTGVVESRLRLYSDDLGRIEALLPPLDEQAAIVRFLDHANRKIDGFIRAKRKLIGLLNEQKQAIIHRAVTRGLDPDAPLKPSGIPWLGDIPSHWEVRRAKQVCSRIIDCKNRTPDLIPDGEFTVVRTTNIRHGRFNIAGSYPTNRRLYEKWTERGAPRVGDVFFTREAPVGEACMVPDLPNICMGQRMMYFRPNPTVLDSEFFLFSIYGPVVRTYIEHFSNGSTVGHLRLGQVNALPLVWCPLEEQQAIVLHINKESEPLNTAIARTEREIALMQEYRTRLTADIVTGKLDVRTAAAKLPDLPTEPAGEALTDEALDETETEDVEA